MKRREPPRRRAAALQQDTEPLAGARARAANGVLDQASLVDARESPCCQFDRAIKTADDIGVNHLPDQMPDIVDGD